MIPRTLEKQIEKNITAWPITLITGARQVGKSTLCGLFSKKHGFGYVSLDDPLERNLAMTHPSSFLENHPSPVIIDEIQYAPTLFDYIEHAVNKKKMDEGNNKGMFILTGSHAYRLMNDVTQSMAGRVNIIEMPPLSLSEIEEISEEPFKIDAKKIAKRTGTRKLEIEKEYRLILRGLYPELHGNPEMNTADFYRNYLKTYLERDVSLLVNVTDKTKFINFMTVIASFTGQELVYETVANAIGTSAMTVKSWVSILETGHVIHLLRPYYGASAVKRVVKHPKLYFWDTGLACYLLGIRDTESLKISAYKGRLVETLIVNEIMKSYLNNCADTMPYYYRDRYGYEIDLILINNGVADLIECKSGYDYTASDTAAFGKIAIDCRIGEKCIICNTDRIYATKDGILVFPITSI